MALICTFVYFVYQFQNGNNTFWLNWNCRTDLTHACKTVLSTRINLANHVATIRSTASGCRSCVSHGRYVNNAATAATATNHSCIGWSNTIFGLDSRYTERRLDGTCDERRSSLLLQVSIPYTHACIFISPLNLQMIEL